MAQEKRNRQFKRFSDLGLETVETILPRWVASKGPRFATNFLEYQLYSHWSDIVGDVLARKLTPMGIRKKTLYLYGLDATMNQEAMFRQQMILQRINAYAGKEIVRQLRISARLWQDPDTKDIGAVKQLLARQKQRAQHDIGRAIRQTALSGEETQHAAQLAQKVDDHELGQAIQRAFQHHLQYNKLKEQHDWHPCAVCGTLCPPEQTYCQRCSQAHADKVHEAVAEVLRDVPWARYPEVHRYVPECTPALVSIVRQGLVQQLAREVDVRDHQSMKARTLVMLYRCLPPEQLTEEKIERALYSLRFDMHIPEGYKFPKRYSVISWGKKTKPPRHRDQAE